MSNYDGGQAFPVAHNGQNGMSLRQWYAGKIAPELAKLSVSGEIEGYSVKDAAGDAFKFADAMIKKGQIAG